MSKSVRLNDYRLKIHCFSCDSQYITNIIHSLKLPRRCKYCGSTKIEKIDQWRVHYD